MRRRRDSGNSKAAAIILSILCVGIIALSLVSPASTGAVQSATGIVVVPIQKGISAFGGWLSGMTSNFRDTAELREENAALKERVDALTAQNSQLVLNEEELLRLRQLLELDEQYAEYETTGARVIARDSGNWFSTFTIDKGSRDGIKVDCNVMAGSGLVGIVTQVGPNWARVRSIIDDDSNVSAMVSTTSDTCIIAGNLQLIDKGTLSLVKLSDEGNKVHVGDKVVTSNISEKYLPDILIGYICELNNDSNNLTKSGEITPVVDFRHLQEVLVILETKDYEASTDDAAGRDKETEARQEEEEAQTEAGEQDLLAAPRAGEEAEGAEGAEGAGEAEGDGGE